MKKIIIINLFTILIFINGCDDAAVNIEDYKYEAKIVVEGYIYPGQSVKEIKLKRNFKISNGNFDEQIELTPAENSVVAEINGIELEYDADKKSYYNKNIMVNNSKSYTLEVSAIIDGENLSTSSTTITPPNGFYFHEKNIGEFKFDAEYPYFSFSRSEYKNEFYVFSIVADVADTSNFIYDHPLHPKINRENLSNELESFQHNSLELIDLSSAHEDILEMGIGIDITNFYTSYRVIGYAGDINFKDFYLMAGYVQDMDGNFYAPYFHFEGDGIGIFGSAVTDTLRFNIVK